MENHLKRVHANIHETISPPKDNHPHHGKDFKELDLLIFSVLIRWIKKGIITQIKKMQYAINTTSEKAG